MLCEHGKVYVDPSENVYHKGEKFSGRGNDSICPHCDSKKSEKIEEIFDGPHPLYGDR